MNKMKSGAGCLSAFVVLSALMCEAADVANMSRVEVSPGQSLEKALASVRELVKSKSDGTVELEFAPGEYRLNAPLVLDGRDGGAENGPCVIWRSKVPGAAVLTTSVKVPVARFARVTDESVLSKMPQEGRDKAFVADVSDLLPADRIGDVELFLDGGFAEPARWPNEGEFTSFRGKVDGGRNIRGGRFEGGAFVYSNPRAKRWNFADGVKIFGYLNHDWSGVRTVAHSYGTENGTNDVIRLTGQIPYGVNNGTQGRKDRRFYVYDMLEELDAPREWWLDRTHRLLYVVPEKGEFEAQTDVRLAVRRPAGSDAIVSARRVSNLRIEGLSFVGHYGPAVVLKKARGVRFADCRFRSVVGTALDLAGEGLTVSGCELSDLGGVGIALDGGSRSTLASSGNVVENCRVLRFGQRKRTYAGAVEVVGCGHVIRSNEFAYAPHHAMRYQSNDTVIEFNDIHDVLLETGDAGAIYTGRDCTTQGNVVRYNFIHDLGVLKGGLSTVGVYFDDCDCGDEAYGNVFWRCDRGILLGGGRDHPIRNNIFADCRIGMSIDLRGLRWGCFYELKNGNRRSCYQPSRMEKMKVTEEPWRSRYPRLATLLQDDPVLPLHNPVEGNVFMGCTQDLVRLSKELTPYLPRMTFSGNLVFAGADGKSAAPDPRIESAFSICTNDVSAAFRNARAGDFRLVPDSVVLQRIPAFRDVPLDRILRLR